MVVLIIKMKNRMKKRILFFTMIAAALSFSCQKAELENNEVAELQKILSARTVVRWQGDKLVGIDYIDYFPEFQQVADEIDKAKEFCEDEKREEIWPYVARSSCCDGYLGGKR